MLHRRGFFQFGGVSLLLRAACCICLPRSTRRARRRLGLAPRACILLFQVGGPYQADTFDPKPDAFEEIRGIFSTIATRVPGLRMTDALPLVVAARRQVRDLARHATTRSAAITRRSIAAWSAARRPIRWRSPIARPLGAPIIRISLRWSPGLRPPQTSMPFHVIIPNTTNNGPAKSPGLLGGYLGAAYDPFVLGADPSRSRFPRRERRPAGGSRFAADSRRGNRCCSASIETAAAARARRRRRIDEHALSTCLQHADGAGIAVRVRSEPRSRTACAIAMAGIRRGKRRSWPGGSSRRGCRSSRSSRTSMWIAAAGTRIRITTPARRRCCCRPPINRSAPFWRICTRAACSTRRSSSGWASSAARRGWGCNFSNNTNNVGGRDHWCNCYSVVLAGGGVRGGNVVGSSDQFAAYPRERPVHVSELRPPSSTSSASTHGPSFTISRGNSTRSATAIR